VVPAKFALEAVTQCANKGVKYAIVITSGFSEIGNAEEERKMVEVANKKSMRNIGAECFWYLSAESSLNSTFAGSVIPAGHLGIITQSGALGLGDDRSGHCWSCRFVGNCFRGK